MTAPSPKAPRRRRRSSGVLREFVAVAMHALILRPGPRMTPAEIEREAIAIASDVARGFAAHAASLEPTPEAAAPRRSNVDRPGVK